MDWEALGAIGELVGAVGVIATLVYLAMQIRQNSNVVRSSTRQAISKEQKDMGIQIVTNPEARAAAMYWIGLEEDPALAAQVRNDMFIRACLRMWENQYHQYKDGTFELDIWEGYLENMIKVLNQKRFQAWWPSNRALYSANFSLFIDSMISTNEIR